MRHSLLLPALAALTASVQAQISPPLPTRCIPSANFTTLQPVLPPPALLVGGADSCVTPDVIVGTGNFAFDNTLATRGTEGQHEGYCLWFGFTSFDADVWFTWTAPATGLANLTTCGLTNVDTKIAVYTGNTCPTNAPIVCIEDGCVASPQSNLLFYVTAGTAYVIQLGNSDAPPPAMPGTGTFRLTVSVPQSNDDCSTPTTLVGTGPFSFDNGLATTSAQGQTSCSAFGSAAIQNDMWYTWTSTINGLVGVRTCGQTSVDTKIAVYSGSGCAAAVGTAIACNDDGCAGTSQSEADFTAVLGQIYTIQLGLTPFQVNGGIGTFDIVQPPPPPANDDCSTPTLLVGPGTYLFDNTLASTGTQGQVGAACLFPGGNGIEDDLWYTYRATTNGTARVTTCGLTTTSNPDTKIAVYAGAGCPVAAAIACNDNDGACSAGGLNSTVTWNTVCGTSYTIQLGSHPGLQPGHQPIAGMFLVSEIGAACAGAAYCFGDGSGTACPCTNNGGIGNGCANSLVATGAHLSSSGGSSLSADTLVLTCTGMPNSSALYFQGTAQTLAGAGTAFGDGKRCVSGTVTSLGTKRNTAGTSSYPVGADPKISVMGLVPVAGATRDYQVWYRNAAAFCTVSTFNLSNGLEVVWTP